MVWYDSVVVVRVYGCFIYHFWAPIKFSIKETHAAAIIFLLLCIVEMSHQCFEILKIKMHSNTCNSTQIHRIERFMFWKLLSLALDEARIYHFSRGDTAVLYQTKAVIGVFNLHIILEGQARCWWCSQCLPLRYRLREQGQHDVEAGGPRGAAVAKRGLWEKINVSDLAQSMDDVPPVSLAPSDAGRPPSSTQSHTHAWPAASTFRWWLQLIIIMFDEHLLKVRNMLASLSQKVMSDQHFFVGIMLDSLATLAVGIISITLYCCLSHILLSNIWLNECYPKNSDFFKGFYWFIMTQRYLPSLASIRWSAGSLAPVGDRRHEEAATLLTVHRIVRTVVERR